jgi:hypothetical protein
VSHHDVRVSKNLLANMQSIKYSLSQLSHP